MMFRFTTIALAMLPSGLAMAHSSLVPHSHPHGESTLLSLEAALGAGVAIAALITGAVLVRRAIRTVKVRATARRRA